LPMNKSLSLNIIVLSRANPKYYWGDCFVSLATTHPYRSGSDFKKTLPISRKELS
jgi:hypothetical protein